MRPVFSYKKMRKIILGCTAKMLKKEYFVDFVSDEEMPHQQREVDGPPV